MKAKDNPTAGKMWFDMPRPEMTDKLRRELMVVRNRNTLDPKRFYKTSKQDKKWAPTYFQVGTVVAGAMEGRAHRRSRADRHRSLFDEVRKDGRLRQYAEKEGLSRAKATQKGGKKEYRDRAKRRRQDRGARMKFQ